MLAFKPISYSRDPKAEGTIEGRIDYAFRNRIYADSSLEQIREKIRHDIALGIVGLFEACRKCAIVELILTPMPLLDRYEIFRDAIWVTLYSDPGQGMSFPRTLRFPASSVMYRMQEADCLQVVLHPNARVIKFPRTMTAADMLKIYEEITGQTLSQSEYGRLRADFLKFAEEFARQAGIRRDA